MTNQLLQILSSLFRRKGRLAPVRIRTGLLMAFLVTAMTAASPGQATAQRSSSSKGSTERTESRSSGRSVKKSDSRSSKARSSRSGRTSSRVETARKAGKVIGAIRSAKGRSSDRNTNRSVDRSTGRSQDRAVRSGQERGNNRATARGDNGRANRNDGVRQSGNNRSVGSSTNRTRGVEGARVLDRSANGRVAAARGASRTSRDRNIVIDGRRSRLTLPGVRATWRSGAKSHVRFRTHVRVGSKRYYRPHNRISVHIAWPWQVRYHRHWSPRYRYRQVVVVHADWNRSSRTSRIEMETTYRHKVRFATDEYAVLDIDIEQIALYDNGRYIGMVDRIPAHLSSVEATVFRNGDIAFDRDIFLVGDRRAGFEILSTPFYDGYAAQGYRYGDDVRVGQVDLRKNRVRSKNYSRLFDTRRWQGYAPISLLPEDDGWLWDFGADAISAAYDDYDAYYGYGDGIRGGYQSREAYDARSDYAYETAFGAQFNVERTATIRRVE